MCVLLIRDEDEEASICLAHYHVTGIWEASEHLQDTSPLAMLIPYAEILRALQECTDGGSLTGKAGLRWFQGFLRKNGEKTKMDRRRRLIEERLRKDPVLVESLAYTLGLYAE